MHANIGPGQASVVSTGEKNPLKFVFFARARAFENKGKSNGNAKIKERKVTLKWTPYFVLDIVKVIDVTLLCVVWLRLFNALV